VGFAEAGATSALELDMADGEVELDDLIERL
jgi:hypothetical protein